MGAIQYHKQGAQRCTPLLTVDAQEIPHKHSRRRNGGRETDRAKTIRKGNWAARRDRRTLVASESRTRSPGNACAQNAEQTLAMTAERHHENHRFAVRLLQRFVGCLCGRSIDRRVYFAAAATLSCATCLVLVSGVATFGERFALRRFAHERGHLDAVGLGPSHFLSHGEATTPMPTLIGIQTAARPIHAGKRLAEILFTAAFTTAAEAGKGSPLATTNWLAITSAATKPRRWRLPIARPCGQSRIARSHLSAHTSSGAIVICPICQGQAAAIRDRTTFQPRSSAVGRRGRTHGKPTLDPIRRNKTAQQREQCRFQFGAWRSKRYSVGLRESMPC